MPHASDIQKRDRAILALLMLTGVRDGALIMLRLKHIDLEDKSVAQNPREAATKFCKSIVTFFETGFPQAEQAIAQWVRHQREVMLRDDDDPLFPETETETETGVGATGGFRATGLSRGFRAMANGVRRICGGGLKPPGC